MQEKINILEEKNDQVSIKERKELEKIVNESIWEKLQRGDKMSDIDFNQINYEALDRMWVGGSMLARFLKFWIDPYEAERDPILAAFFKSAGTQSVSELGKRVFLTFRDLPGGYKNLLAAILPDMISLYEAHSCGLMGTDLGTPEGETILEKWNFKMAKWIRAFKWMPNIMYDEETLYREKEDILQNWDGIKNLGNDLALITITKKLALERIAQAAYASDKDVLTATYAGLLSVYNDNSMGDVLTREGGEADTNPKTNNVNRERFDQTSEKSVEERLFGRG